MGPDGRLGLGEAEWADVLRLLAAARAVRDERTPERAAVFAQGLAAAARSADRLMRDVYLPLVAATAKGPLTIGQVGQSLDGRIASATGGTTLINGEAGLDHLHRLRAMVDAVIVGASTVAVDDPLLTTRRVRGDSPVRVVIDPRRRAAPSRRVFAEPVPTLIVYRTGTTLTAALSPVAPLVTAAAVPDKPLPPRLIVSALRRRGLKSLLIEGGPATLSLFLAAHELDRLHIIVAPIVIGAGPCGFALPPPTRINDAMTWDVAVHDLGTDTLLDCQPRREPRAASPSHSANISR